MGAWGSREFGSFPILTTLQGLERLESSQKWKTCLLIRTPNESLFTVPHQTPLLFLLFHSLPLPYCVLFYFIFMVINNLIFVVTVNAPCQTWVALSVFVWERKRDLIFYASKVLFIVLALHHSALTRSSCHFFYFKN